MRVNFHKLALATLVLCLPALLFADDHIVPLDEVHQQARASSETRTKDVADIERVLAYPAAAGALQKSHVNQEQMRKAVATSRADFLHKVPKKPRTVSPCLGPIFRMR